MPQLKRPRSQREPTTNFKRYPSLQQEKTPGGGEASVLKDQELEESMSLFMDFVEAAASQPQQKAKRAPKASRKASANASSAAENLVQQALQDGVGRLLAHPGASENGQGLLQKTALGKKAGAGAKGAKNQSSVRASVNVHQRVSTSTSKGSRPWTPAEEHDLMKLVEIYGNKRWSYIAQLINGRTGKQCRERWLNHLRPNIKKDEWSAEEERILAEGHARLGTKWSSLAKLLPGRTENSIKNHWNATLRCKGRLRSNKGSSRGNKPGVLKEYMDSLQRGLSAEKAVEIACFAETLSKALAKEQPNQGSNGDQARKVQQEVHGLVSDVKKANGSQSVEGDAKHKEKKMKNADNVYLTKRHVPHIDEWSFQYNDLGSDWAWYWKLHNSRADVKIIERVFNPALDLKWPHGNSMSNGTEDALTYTCVGTFDKGISASQYHSRALQCVLSACVFVVQRNDDVRINVKIYLSMNDKEKDTLLVSVHSTGGIGKTTGLQEMLRQIKTVLTLTANNNNSLNQSALGAITARKAKTAQARREAQKKKEVKVVVRPQIKEQAGKMSAKKEEEASDSETISEPGAVPSQNVPKVGMPIYSVSS